LKKLLIILGVVSLLFGSIGVCGATLVQWSSDDGGNDHWYEVVEADDPNDPNDPNYISWSAAAVDAEERGGYLATLTSPEEENFVNNALGIYTNNDYWFKDGADNWQGPWLGGYQVTDDDSTPASDWKWVTGEAWSSYINWANGEPNDAGPEPPPNFLENGHEQYLQFFWQEGAPIEPKWNDIVHNSPVHAYIVEYNPIPEPNTILLLSTGLIGFAGFNRRKK